ESFVRVTTRIPGRSCTMVPIHRRPQVEALESRDVPAPLFAVTTTDHLVSFDNASPGTFLTDTAITGVGAGEEIEGIDFSPTSGSLFAITSKNGVGRLYQLNPSTAVAGLRIPNAIPSSGTLTGTDFGFDFNPVSGRPRIV